MILARVQQRTVVARAAARDRGVVGQAAERRAAPAAGARSEV
jgi:hypothetical protein